MPLNEVAPTVAERDEDERFDREIFSKMAELGLTGIPWPEQYGGIGSDYLAYCIAVEELSRVDASIWCYFISTYFTSQDGHFISLDQRSKNKNTYVRWHKVKKWGLTV